MLDAIPALDLERVVSYVASLGNATTAAKTGSMLERGQDRLGVSPGVLCRLEHMRPRGPHYLSRSHRVSGRYVARWHLVVPPLITLTHVIGTHDDIRRDHPVRAITWPDSSDATACGPHE